MSKDFRLVRLARFAAAFCSAALLGVAHAGEVTVEFQHSDRYTDMNLQHMPAADSMKAIADHLKSLGARLLPADQTLKVEVLDVALAGSDEWWPPNTDKIRVLRSVTWPRIDLRYTLVQGDRTLRSGEESVRDMAYLDHVSTYFDDDPYRYEKHMLDDWFKRRLVDPAQGKRD
jgi:hypothetical protein